jgi:hypothetical protein
MDCITGAGGRGGGAGGGGGGAGIAAGGGGGAGGGASIIFSAHADSNNTKDRHANFALVVCLAIFMDLRYAQGALGVGDALPREMSP